MNTTALCHGKSDRCFSYRGRDLPICARCSAIYLGFFTSLVFEYLYGLPGLELIPLWILIIIPTGVDGITQLVGKRESTNLIRFLTGFPAGLGIMFLVRIGRVVLL